MEQMVGVVRIDRAAPTVTWHTGDVAPEPAPRPAVIHLNRVANSPEAPVVSAESSTEQSASSEPADAAPAKRKYTRRSPGKAR